MKPVTRTLLMSAVLASPAATVAATAGASGAAVGNIYYVAPNGSDSGAGTQALPWASIRPADRDRLHHRLTR